MELLDYMKYRWKSMTAAVVIGLVAIVLLGLRSGGDGYEARSKLLIVPPVNQQAGFASDPDRYIDTQMTLLKTPGYLEAEVAGTDATPAQLAKSLGYTHTAGSDVVTLQYTSSQPQEAVTLVNAAANGFITYTTTQEKKPAEQEAAALEAQIDEAKAELLKANAKIDDARAAFIAANPGEPVPLPSALAPKASSDATVATGRLQQLVALQSSSELDQATTVSRSRVLTPALTAVPPPGWELTTYIGAAMGLLLLLLTAAAVGLALSTRVLSQSRWIEATDGGCLGRGIRLRRFPLRQRRRTVRRVATALDAIGAPDAPTFALYLPEKTSAMKRKTKFLLKGLGADHFPAREIGSIAELLAAVPSVRAAPGSHSRAAEACSAHVLLLVDLAGSYADDVGLLCDALQPVRRLVVPVLV
jgi:capsular polysaccharide biosynthesis protein